MFKKNSFSIFHKNQVIEYNYTVKIIEVRSSVMRKLKDVNMLLKV